MRERERESKGERERERERQRKREREREREGEQESCGAVLLNPAAFPLPRVVLVWSCTYDSLETVSYE